MPFSLSANTIIQTGIDNDLSSLQGLAGVGFDAISKTYSFDGRLIVQGNLRIDPEFNRLALSDSSIGSSRNGLIRVAEGARLILGNETDPVRETLGTAIILNDKRNQNFLNFEAGGIEIFGRFEAYGATVQANSGIGFEGEATGFIRGLRFLVTGAGDRRPFSFEQTGAVDVEDLVLDATSQRVFLRLVTAPQSFSGAFRNARMALQNVTIQDFLFDGVAFERNRDTADVELSGNRNNQRLLELRNVDIGSNIRVQGVASRSGLLVVTSTVAINSTLDGVEVPFSYSLFDHADGTYLPASNFPQFDHLVTQTEYKAINITGLQRFNLVTMTANNEPGNDNPIVVSRYDEGQDGSDRFSITTYAYGTLPARQRFIAKGGKGVDIVAQRVSDTLVSEVDVNVVAAYPIVVSQTADSLTIQLTSGVTVHQLYDFFHRRSFITARPNPITRSGSDLQAGSLNVTIDGAALDGSLTTSGIVTLRNGGAVTGGIIDANGIRAALALNNGNSFSALLRRDDNGAEIGFFENVKVVAFQIPFGVPVSYSIWEFGHDTVVGSFDPTRNPLHLVSTVANKAIDTSLDVDAIVADIDLSLTPTSYDLTFNAAIELDIEQIKAAIHALQGREISLRAALTAGASMQAFRLEETQISILSPAIRLLRGPSLTVHDRVILNAFFEQGPAHHINPAFTLTPVSNAARVEILRVKPALDPAQVAGVIETLLGKDIRLARDHARAANVQTQRT